MEGRGVIVVLVLVVLGVFAPAAAAQAAPLTGRVLDEQGVAIAGADVWLQSDPSVRDTSDMDGNFQLAAVPVDQENRLVADASGFIPYLSEPFVHVEGVGRDVVLVNAPPAATISGPSRALRGEPVRFTATDVSADVVAYAWTRPGATSPDQGMESSTTVSYAESGAKVVSLTVTDDRDAQTTASATLRVNHPPSAALTHSAAPRAGEDVVFKATGDDDDGDPLTFTWDVDGDGIADGKGATFSHRYPTSGIFTIAVLVNDGFESSEAFMTVVVAGAPLAPAPGPLMVQPAPQPPATAADVTAPALTVKRLGTRALKAARRRGLRFALSCDEPCTVYLEAVVGRRTARKLKLGRKATRIGRVTAASGPAGSHARLKLRRKAARRLARVRRVRITVQGSAWDAGGYATLYAPRALTLRRAP